MKPDTYYRDHWVEVGTERLETYQQMFTWRPEMAPLIAPADLRQGQVVVDYGCGPGGLSLELARRVGPSGHVHGVDLNADFVAVARKALSDAGFSASSTVHQATDDRIPLGDAAADRLICKNVMEYVPDVTATLREFHRVLRPGGLAHVIDSDWGTLVVEPLGAETLAERCCQPKSARPGSAPPLPGVLGSSHRSSVKTQGETRPPDQCTFAPLS